MDVTAVLKLIEDVALWFVNYLGIEIEQFQGLIDAIKSFADVAATWQLNLKTKAPACFFAAGAYFLHLTPILVLIIHNFIKKVKKVHYFSFME